MKFSLIQNMMGLIQQIRPDLDTLSIKQIAEMLTDTNNFNEQEINTFFNNRATLETNISEAIEILNDE